MYPFRHTLSINSYNITISFLLLAHNRNYISYRDGPPISSVHCFDKYHIYYVDPILHAFSATFCLFWLPGKDGKVNG